MKERKYDIGHGIILRDNGYQLTAEFETDEHCSRSVGCVRPRVGPLPAEVEITYSRDRGFFYLNRFASCFGAWGFWLGTKAWKSREEIERQPPRGAMGYVLGKSGYQFNRTDTGETYFRETLPFPTWDVKSDPNREMISTKDEMARDYLSLCLSQYRESEESFNKEIAFSGRTLKWIMERIGPWVDESDLPPTVLS